MRANLSAMMRQGVSASSLTDEKRVEIESYVRAVALNIPSPVSASELAEGEEEEGEGEWEGEGEKRGRGQGAADGTMADDVQHGSGRPIGPPQGGGGRHGFQGEGEDGLSPRVYGESMGPQEHNG